MIQHSWEAKKGEKTLALLDSWQSPTVELLFKSCVNLWEIKQRPVFTEWIFFFKNIFGRWTFRFLDFHKISIFPLRRHSRSEIWCYISQHICNTNKIIFFCFFFTTKIKLRLIIVLWVGIRHCKLAILSRLEKKLNCLYCFAVQFSLQKCFKILLLG